MRRRSLRLVAGLAVATALVGGCSSKHEANHTLPSASETSASPSLEPLGPADFPVPDEARQETEDGVVAFSTYYFELSNYLLKTLDSGPLRELSRNCQTCDDLADGYDADRASGYRYEGGDITVSSTGSALIHDGTAEIAIALHQDAVIVRDASGSEVPTKSTEAYSLSGGMGLVWDSQLSTWLVTQLDAERVG